MTMIRMLVSEERIFIHIEDVFIAPMVAQAGLALLRLYTSILFPVVVVASWMFALYAALSYAVPNKLCSNALRSNAVRSLGPSSPQILSRAK